MRTHSFIALLLFTMLHGCGSGSDAGDAQRPSSRGILDGQFGENGLVVVPNSLHGGFPASADDLAVLDDGRILLSGTYRDRLGRGVGVIARLTPRGSLDATFASGGVLALTGSTLFEVAGTRIGGDPAVWAHHALCADPMSGDPLCATRKVFARRISRAGSVLLDPTYGNAGTATVHLAPAALVVAPDGAVTVVGASAPGLASLRAERLDRDGHPDAGFAARAAGALDVGCPGYGGVAAAAVDPGGGIVVAWSRYDGLFHREVCLVRLLADGSRDPRFGVGGVSLVVPATPLAATTTLLARRDGGSILVVGTSHYRYPAIEEESLLWLDASGGLERARGTDGVLPGTAFDIGVIRALAQQADGKILVAGHRGPAVLPSAPDVPRLARLTPEGSLDLSFGASGDGLALLSSFGRDLRPRRVLVGPDGAIYVAGDACPTADPCSVDERSLALMRFGAGSP